MGTRADHGFVEKTYKSTFEAAMGQVTLLNYSKLFGLGDLRYIEMMAGAIPHCQRLKVLLLNGNPMDLAGLKLIMPALEGCPVLTQLQLCDCDIDASGSAIMAEHLPNLLSLEQFILNGNPLTDNGIAALAQALP